MDPIIAPLLAAGSNAFENLTNTVSTVFTNKSNRKYAEKMYERQRKDALADWNMMNSYNNPQEQMKRFAMAGLNPNLIYKQNNEGATVRSTEMRVPDNIAPKLDLSATGSALDAYYNAELKQAQVDNLKAQNDVIIQDAVLRAAQVAATGVQTEKGKFDLELAKELRTTSLEVAKQQLSNLKTDQYVKLSQNEQQLALTSQSLKEGVERILNYRLQRAKTQDEREEIRARIRSIDKDSRLKALDIELKDKGIQPTDNLFLRILARIIGGDTNDEKRNPALPLNPDSLRKAYNDWKLK